MDMAESQAEAQHHKEKENNPAKPRTHVYKQTQNSICNSWQVKSQTKKLHWRWQGPYQNNVTAH